MKQYIVLVVLIAGFVCSVSAENAPHKDENEKTQVQALEERNEQIKNDCEKKIQCSKKDIEELAENESKIDSATAKFRFGVALGYEAYKDHYINSVEVLGDTKTVHIADSQEFKPSFWLE